MAGLMALHFLSVQTGNRKKRGWQSWNKTVSSRVLSVREAVRQKHGDEANRHIQTVFVYTVFLAGPCRRGPQKCHMATAEQMALVALQYCFSSEARYPPLLMMQVNELQHVRWWQRYVLQMGVWWDIFSLAGWLSPITHAEGVRPISRS